MAEPSFSEMTRQFARIGCLSFGGPAGQIALMHREIVEERGWVDEERYLSALNLCHLLPGPEAQQLATWIGWRLHGVRGGLVAGGLFVLPGALVMLALSFLYLAAAGLGWFAALFLGVKAAVLAIVVQALIRIGGRALKTPLQRGLAVAAFVALFFFDAPFPLVVLGAGAIGMALPDAVLRRKAEARGGELGDPGPRPSPGHATWVATAQTILVWLTAWLAPLALVLAILGPEHVLWRTGLFFSQLAIVTFGGAYAVLAYMAQEAVQSYGWLSAGEMADGLGLAETTPGPLIMVTQFVGTLAAYRAPAPFEPWAAGVIGAALTTWVTFAPCFLWIFALAPWMERLERLPRLKGALAAITGAVVGVIANLTLWFALTVAFARVGEARFGLLRLYAPDPASFDWRVPLLAGIAALLLFIFKRGVMTTLAVAAAAGLGLSAL